MSIPLTAPSPSTTTHKTPSYTSGTDQELPRGVAIPCQLSEADSHFYMAKQRYARMCAKYVETRLGIGQSYWAELMTSMPEGAEHAQLECPLGRFCSHAGAIV